MKTEKKSIRDEHLKWIEAKKEEGKMRKDLKAFPLEEVLDPNFKLSGIIPKIQLKKLRSAVEKTKKKMSKEDVEKWINKTIVITIKGKITKVIQTESKKELEKSKRSQEETEKVGKEVVKNLD